jgi:hypothetical protein
MPRRLVTLFAAAAMTSGVAAGPASADPGGVPASPGSQCQPAFELVSVREVLRIAVPGFVNAIRAEDRNQDGQLCLKLLPEPIPLFEPTFLFYDNRLPAR